MVVAAIYAFILAKDRQSVSVPLDLHWQMMERRVLGQNRSYYTPLQQVNYRFIRFLIVTLFVFKLCYVAL